MCFQSDCLGQKLELLLTWDLLCVRAVSDSRDWAWNGAFYSWVTVSTATQVWFYPVYK